jgi:predicted nucleotidyltransferase
MSIRRGGAESLRAYSDAGEGLENRIFRAAGKARGFEELVALSAAKRYPKSRIRRILTHALLGLDAAALEALGAKDAPPYLRVLGFSDGGRRLLSQAKPAAPVIVNYKRLRRAGARAQGFMRLEARATDIYASAFQNPNFRAPGQDFLRSPAKL